MSKTGGDTPGARPQPLVLFVCTGNVCRSPMAAALFLGEMEKRGDSNRFRVESAGTWGLDGSPASEPARQVMAERGLSLEHHRARTLTQGDVDRADLILVMTRNHRDAIVAEFASARSKVHLISELRGIEYDIKDPYLRPLPEYQACAHELEELISNGYERVVEWLDARAP